MKLAKLNGGAEIFFTVQGEGRNIGRPAVFVRTSMCNLHCVWCDTDYTWNWVGTSFPHVRDSEPGYAKYVRAEQIVELSPEEVAEEVAKYSCRHVVMTGGEPLVHQADWVAMMDVLRARDAAYYFEVETNGTLLPRDDFDARMNQYNVSPKLSNAGVAELRRIKEGPLRYFATSNKAWFKFVVENESNLAEVDELVARFHIDPRRVYLMPQGTDVETLDARAAWLAEACMQRGYALSDRLHVRLYGAKRGV
ncbi:MAG: 7-carboxy-7-deazaguanine synthase QueE [Candidatus Hydrogenedentales bacterium]